MKVWLVAAITYRQGVRSLSFLILTLALPLLMVSAGALPWVLGSAGAEEPPGLTGYVDQTAEIPLLSEIPTDGDARLIRFDSASAALRALDRGEISGYLVIPAGYLRGEQTRYVGEARPGPETRAAWEAALRQALAPDADRQILARIADPAAITHASLSGDVVAEGPLLAVRALFPGILGVLFALAVFTGAGQMGAAVIREKEHRAMEMVITSLRPSELVAGKVLGMTLLSLTQMAMWAMGGIAGVGILFAGTSGGAAFRPPWGAVAWAAVLGVPGYLLYAVLAAGLGIIAGDGQNAQELAGALGLVAVAPLWLVGILILSPQGAFSVALSLFPLSAPTVLLVRMTLVQVPAWQPAAALSLLLAGLFVSVWGVARVFRAAMLLYGQPLRPRQALQALLANEA